MTKVLLIAPSFGTSGGETRFLECVAWWNAHGSFEETRVITTKWGAVALKNRELRDVKTHIIPLIPLNQHYFFSRALFLSFIVKMVLCLGIVLKMSRAKIRSDIVISTSHFMHDFIPAMIYSKLAKAELVMWVHHLHPSLQLRSKYHPLRLSLLARINDLLAVRMAKKFADRIITYHCMKQQAIVMGIPKNKIRITTDGVNLPYITRIPRSKLDYDACFLGRLYPLKGIHDLIVIWKMVCSKMPHAKLVVIGEGASKFENQLREGIKANHLTENIILTGYLPEDEKYAIMKSCKIFIFPSHEEGLGIAIIEAMACGLPVVAYELPAYKPFGNEAIIKVPKRDMKTFSEAVLKLLVNDRLRLEMSEKAKQTANRFDWDTLIKRELFLLRVTT